MANLNKGKNDNNSFAAPAQYNHGVPQQNSGIGGSPTVNGSGGQGGNGSSGGYGRTTYGDYVEPEIYENGYNGEGYNGSGSGSGYSRSNSGYSGSSSGYSGSGSSYSGSSSGYDNSYNEGFNSPQPQSQSQQRYGGSSYGGTGYADPGSRYSNQQFETMGQNTPYQNQSFDPNMNSNAGAYRGQPQPNVMPNYGMGQGQQQQAQKYCKWCAAGVAYDAVVCTNCGRQIEDLKQAQPNMGMPMGQPQVVINNTNTNVANPYGYAPEMYGMKDKGIALLLSLFFGWFGAHKFYEGKYIMGIIYFFTFGLFGIGNLIDFLVLLGKPKKYLP